MKPAEVFAEWLRRQGIAVLQTPSSYWYESVPHVYQAFPYHWLIAPDERELSGMFDKGAIAVRYSTASDAPGGAPSYHVVYEQREHDIAALSSKARGHVRKGLSIAHVQPISFQRLATEGWELRRDTLIRQGRQNAEQESWWKLLCLSAVGLPGFEAWGAVASGKLVASLLAFAYDDYFSILYQQSRTDFLRFGVNNTLAHVVTAQVLGRSHARRLFYGLQSLDAPPAWTSSSSRCGMLPSPSVSAWSSTPGCGLSRQTVLQRVKRGELRAVHIRAGRRKGLRIELPAAQDGLF